MAFPSLALSMEWGAYPKPKKKPYVTPGVGGTQWSGVQHGLKHSVQLRGWQKWLWPH